jgi:glycosyltransferase involved in cell wall biosynthesis
MRVLVLSNMQPGPEAPHRGSFVRDQADALRRLGVDVELFEFEPGMRNLATATSRIRRLLRQARFDLVHAHFGLAGACARLAGARPLITTFHGTDVRHPATGIVSRRLRRRLDLIALASVALTRPEGGRPPLRPVAGRTAVLPCGADFGRFRPEPRTDARRALGLDPEGRYLFFSADPARRVKRHDRAVAVAEEAGATLLAAGALTPDEMVRHVNAADAVLITSDNEGFGLAAVEAMACDTPVISRPLGAIQAIAAGAPGCFVGEFDVARWAKAADEIIGAPRPRGLRERAAWLSADQAARRVQIAYGEVLERAS